MRSKEDRSAVEQLTAERGGFGLRRRPERLHALVRVGPGDAGGITFAGV
ncbi:MAG: hypothetical protein OXI80_20365 [Caldilineaceae bacterium]|nr:hypothetical protein [Caldilineaceae bacterium]